MNNLNNPPRWNIDPNYREGDGDGNKWSYALLVPMLGLAAFRWIWSRESQKEITKAKEEFKKDVDSIQKDLEMKYRENLIENRRTVARLELEIEKQQQRVESYKSALISQSHKLVEERKLLELEKQRIQEEKQAMLHSGAAAVLYRSAIEKEEGWHKTATAVLEEIEDALVDRQNVRCSFIIPKVKRLEIEKDLLVKAATNPVALHLKMEDGLKDIFKNDSYCANVMNTDIRQNGKLMWLYLKYWGLQIEIQKFKNVQKSILGK
ncbi:coiled-coil domain-containing protein 127 [Protopterus annectens]|uniref:coiled-coil domain-containing protein 127 n=1 Tax=Protopterus annectens TaxID=7888 RepID=UPI001CFA985A|nr:coiled-coil domain-containing protein 127 [Protopterus annectens]XP_043921053.1 coiled-coil domain-containing protein 127 [Protopterus annectens]